MKKTSSTLLILCLGLLLLLPACLNAQQTFKANVIDRDKVPVPMAVVLVLDENNNEKASAVTDSSGNFELILPQDLQDKWLFVQSFGYAALREPLSSAVQRTTFEIVPDAVMMEEVTVQSKHLAVERTANCYTITNISTSPLAPGRSIVDVLKYAPLVSISTSGELEILNKGTASIYVNGRKSNINPKKIPAENIEKIEVITTPGSEYPSTERNGILNIVLKKAPGDGVSGSITIMDNQKENWKLNSPEFNLYLSMQKKKINASIIAGVFYDPYISKQENKYKYQNNQAVENNIRDMQRTLSESLHLLLDWNIKPNQVIGIQLGGTLSHPFIDQTTTDSRYFIPDSQNSRPDSTDVTTRNLDSKLQYTLFGNLNYSLKINDNQNLTLDFFYSRKAKDSPQHYKSQKQYLGDTILSEYLTQSSSITDALDFKAAYKFQINDNLMFQAGLNTYGAMVNYIFLVENKIGTEADETQSNKFDFNDITSALYAKIDWDISSKFSLSAGLRGEYYCYKGIQKVTNDIVSDQMPDIFPSLSLVYNAGRNNVFALDFTSGLNIPGYSQRNPFKVYYSPSLYQANDISLNPCKHYDVDFTYTLFQDYMLNLSYSFTKEAWAQFYLPEDNGVTRITELNYGNSHRLYGSISADKYLFHDYLAMSALFSLSYRIYDVTSEAITAYNPTSPLSFSFDLSLSTALDKKQSWRLSTRFQYSSPYSGAGWTMSDNWFLGADVSKEFENCVLAFGVDDILDWHINYKLNTTAYSFEQNNFHYSRTYWIAFHVRFGNQRTRDVRKHSSTIQGRL